VGVAQHSILAKIDEFIKIENYELAAFYRNQLLILKSLTEKQKIVLKVAEDIDLINLVYQNNPDGEIIGSFFVQQIRDGRIVNVFNSILAGTNIDDNYSQLLDSFLYQYSTINGYNIPLLWSISEYNSSQSLELS
jgi:excinuclease UvrABC nuclease subunit